jgi:hypothetical protein
MFGVMSSLKFLTIEKVDNGWIVTVDISQRDKEESADTRIAKETESSRKLETAKESFRNSLKTMFSMQEQLTELATPVEPWAETTDREEKLDKVADTLFNSYASPYTQLAIPVATPSPVKTHVFTSREDLIRWVTEMIQPEII